MLRPALLFAILSAAPASEAGKDISFNRDIRPILADKCFHCHGPDSNTREAGLRLDREDSARDSSDRAAAIVPGNAADSELIRRIFSDDPDEQMPPPGSGRHLNKGEKTTLRKWINSGATWEQHWAFIPPDRPLPPEVHSSWPRNPIDQFVLHRLRENKLQPSMETDRHRWLRKVTFDLTGLPPTVEELDSFLADDTNSAFETVVDRLLQSPHYGEHMAADWLDAARYADTDGYQNDGPRTMYRYRDWVIDAYNANMPFDQFTVEQLAGDLLPNATLSQKIATGFNRNHRYNSEAGLVLDEFLLENAVDRVDTTSTVWMGLTLGCARCHDHKYDPFSQREYYQLISFFDNIAECGRAIKFGNSEPWIVAPTTVQQQRLQELDSKISAAEAAIEQSLQTLQQDPKSWGQWMANLEFPANPDIDGNRSEYFPFEDLLADGLRVEQGVPVLKDGLHGQCASFDGHSVLQLGDKGNVTCHARSTLSFWMKAEDVSRGVILSRQKKSSTRPGFCVMLDNGHIRFQIVTRWISGVGTVETIAQLQPDEWVHIAVTNDGTQRALGQQIWINGRPATTRIIHNTNSNTGGTSKGAILRVGGGVAGQRYRGQIDDLGFYERTLFADEIALLAVRSSVSQILITSPDQRTPAMIRKLRDAAARFARTDTKPAAPSSLVRFANAQATLTRLREQRTKLLDSFPTSMVMEERPSPKNTTIRLRGVYNAHGDIVQSDTPSTLPTLPVAEHATRHDFAKWLVSGQHPLTARVTVNRYWQKYFGTGLVKTPEDFGLQGELPSHPDLLDWLAIEFVESGWDVKAIQKLIVLSAAYRQTSRLTGGSMNRKALAVDPGNRLLWRGTRLRLSARQLRDQALYVSGLLTPKIGGPSVSPYQPANLWAEMSNMKYRQSKGADLYRRGLYTIWKRTVAPPGLAILDAADRENCAVRPKRTNTPLQALTLLNETTFVESARHLAQRMQASGQQEPIAWAFRALTCRDPTREELHELKYARGQFLLEFQAAPESATELLSVGESPVAKDTNPVELAADTMICNVLLNLDEVVCRE